MEGAKSNRAPISAALSSLFPSRSTWLRWHVSPRRFSIAPLYGINEKVRVMNARHVTSTRHVFDPSIYTLLIPSLPLCRARLPFRSSRPRNRRVRRVGCAAEYGVARISWRNTWRSFLPANEGEFWICRACHFLKILPLDPALRHRAYKFREGTRDYWDSVTEIG